MFMRLAARIGLTVVAVMATVGWVAPANTGAETRKVYATYESPNHIKFYSYTPTWNKTKLEQLYRVLMHNAHGEEMSLLTTVNVFPEDFSFDGDREFHLQCQVDSHHRPIRLLPGCTLNLYYGDVLNTPEKMSPVLSHEYGHLFTYYWLVKKEHKFPDDPTTGWAKIRKLDHLPVRWNNSHLKPNHFWRPDEIMADDYYYLFGAPEGKQSMVPSGMGFGYATEVENVVIPAPESIPALKLYWERLSGIRYNNGDTLTEPHITGIEVTNPEGAPHPVYKVHFTSPSTNPSTYGVTPMQEDTTTVAVGAAGSDGTYHHIPKGQAYLRVFALDEKTNQLVWSPMYWYDFSDPQHPKQIPNQFDIKS
jgi:hypothetical protein